MKDSPPKKTVADLTPKQLQPHLQLAVFVGTFGAHFVFGAAVLILALLLR